MPDSLRDQQQTSLGAAYIYERELAAGGMSRVFLFRDETLGRHVVAKVLAPELAEGLSAGRFAREIRLVAALQEPHIVPVLTAGAMPSGLPWYTMPFVRGESLRARLQRGPVPVGEALAILRDVAHALAYAHAQGVVHRDIKPENVLLNEGTAVVTDFGIAKALSASKTQAPGGTLTVIGTSLGTPAYMAPEQAAGDEIDHRADIYAWGVLAYELLAGYHPFAGKTSAQQLMAAHIAEPVRGAPWGRLGVPRALGTLVMRCLEKVPTARPQSAEEILHALEETPLSGGVGRREWMLGAAALALAASIAVVMTSANVHQWWRAWRDRPAATDSSSALPTGRSIAVLPFENAGDSAAPYFAEGLTNEIRGKLAALPMLRVIAGGSSRQYRNTEKPLKQIASELGVEYLLVGQVRWVTLPDRRRRVGVSPELIRIPNGAAPVSRWQQTFEADPADVFAVEADVARRVADQLEVVLTSEEQRGLTRPPTSNFEAWEAFLRAQSIEQEGSSLSVQHRAAAAYREAIRADSTFSDAWAGLSEIYVSSYVFGVPSRALADSARRAAERAVALAPANPLAHSAMGTYRAYVRRDFATALANFEAALRLAPRNSFLLRQVADMETKLDRLDAATRHMERAAQMDPRSPGTVGMLGGLYLRLKRLPEARREADRALTLSPRTLDHIAGRMQISLAEGDELGARAVLRAGASRVDSVALVVEFAERFGWLFEPRQERLLLRLTPAAFGGDRAQWAFCLAEGHARRGDGRRARAYADSARAAYELQFRGAPESPALRVHYAMMLALLGRREDAVAEGERAASLRPVSGSPDPYIQHQLARVYIAAGKPEQAVDRLQLLLHLPYMLTREWLRVDPDFAALRGVPRFERLLTQ